MAFLPISDRIGMHIASRHQSLLVRLREPALSWTPPHAISDGNIRCHRSKTDRPPLLGDGQSHWSISYSERYSTTLPSFGERRGKNSR